MGSDSLESTLVRVGFPHDLLPSFFGTVYLRMARRLGAGGREIRTHLIDRSAVALALSSILFSWASTVPVGLALLLLSDGILGRSVGGPSILGPNPAGLHGACVFNTALRLGASPIVGLPVRFARFPPTRHPNA